MSEVLPVTNPISSSSKSQSTHHLDRASFLSKLTFWYMQSIMTIGYRRPLLTSDLPSRPPINDRCNVITPKFFELVNSHKSSSTSSSGLQLLRLYLFNFGEHFFKGFACLLIWVSLYPLQPVFVRSVLRRLDSKSDSVFSDLNDLTLWILLSSSALIQILALNHAFYHLYRFSARTKTAMMSVLFSKTIRLSQYAKLKYGTGKITTMMSVDSQRIAMAFVLSHWLWMGYVYSLSRSAHTHAYSHIYIHHSPLLCIVSLFLIYTEVGYVVVVPTVLVVTVCFVQAYVARQIGRFRRRIMKLTDDRISFTSEILSGIRVIKSNAWESSASEIVNKIRTKEMTQVRNLLFLQGANMCLFFIAPILICLSTFGVYTYIIVDGDDINVTKVITVLGYIFLLRLPMAITPKAIGMASEAMVSFRRIEEFLFHGTEISSHHDSHKHQLEYKNDSTHHNKSEESSKIELELPTVSKTTTTAASSQIFNIPSGKSFSWGPKNIDKDCIRFDTRFTVKRGEFVCVCGTVGSGKTSLLSILTNELFGELQTHHTTAVVSQTPWIQNVRLRDAIVFGRSFVKSRYEQVIKQCQLRPDLKVLPAGDLTEIGERGITLSGGQKQRIAIARACYDVKNTDLYLLDDSLSKSFFYSHLLTHPPTHTHVYIGALDVHVGRKIFHEVITGMLSEKTRILVLSSHYHLLSYADRVVVMEDGVVRYCGPPKEAIKQYERIFGKIKFNKKEKEDDKEEEDEHTKEEKEEEYASKKKPSVKKAGVLYEKEDRKTGSVGVIKQTLTWMGMVRGRKFQVAGFVFSLFILTQVSRTMSDIFLTAWAQTPTTQRFAVYSSIIACMALLTLSRSLVFVQVACAASKEFHQLVLNSVMRAPINTFFDVVPTGVILNRFSSDLDHIDVSLPEFAAQFFQNALYVVAAVILCAVSSYLFLAALLPLFVVYAYTQNYYRMSSRELKRIENITRSPIFSTFAETLSGLITIRAFDAISILTKQMEQYIDQNSSLFLYFQLSSRWLAVRLDCIGITMFSCISALALFVSFANTSTEFVGLGLIYSLQVTGLLQWTVRTFIETGMFDSRSLCILFLSLFCTYSHIHPSENNLVSVQRLSRYTDSIPVEKYKGTDDPSSSSWPTRGHIQAKNIRMRYREKLPDVLRDLTFEIQDGEKIGICGRTGSGKSSLFSTLLRLVEPHAGRILIDGVDTSSVSLTRLRSSIALIPQDPVLFSGTIRRNLDPFEKYADQDMSKALARVHLNDVKLDDIVKERGENFSVGERQLLCFARVLLRTNCKIILMDEATANVDSSTDNALQEMIRGVFKTKTVICIAHRLETILGCDRIMVMDQGRVVEFDTVQALSNLENGHFASLRREMVRRRRKSSSSNDNSVSADGGDGMMCK